jgi:o-succinylbenzoate synthase
MRIDSSVAIPYRLPLRSPWQSSRGQLRERRGWLISLETGSDLVGYGDCAPLPEAGTESQAESQVWLSRRLPALSGASPAEALALLPSETRCPAARCGLETALLALISQANHQPLRQWLEPSASNRVRVNAAIGAAGPRMVVNARGALDNGFRTLKIKVGTGPMEQELKQLETLARQLPKGTQLRLDANQAWNLDQAHRFVEGVAALPIESLEEPLRHPDCTALRTLQRQVPFDIALDESLSELDLAQITATRAVRRVVLKPTARGGILPALKIASQARTTGIISVVTSCLESAAGIWAAAQLAAAIDVHSGQEHGLATSGWLLQDLGAPPPLKRGLIELPDQPGLGFRPATPYHAQSEPSDVR